MRAHVRFGFLKQLRLRGAAVLLAHGLSVAAAGATLLLPEGVAPAH